MKSLILMPFALIMLCGFLPSDLYGRSALKVEYTKSNISCFGQSNGKIELAISGGKSPYVINWNTGSNEEVLENLKKGEYSVTVSDAQGKSVVEKIEIEMPAPLTILYNSKSETIVDVVNGSMDVAVSGGTPWNVDNANYYFIRLNNQSYFENPMTLEDGIYKINIEDANGCKLNVPVNLDVEIANEHEFEMNSSEIKPVPKYNGMGNVNMTIYKPNPINLVSLESGKSMDN